MSVLYPNVLSILSLCEKYPDCNVSLDKIPVKKKRNRFIIAIAALHIEAYGADAVKHSIDLNPSPLAQFMSLKFANRTVTVPGSKGKVGDGSERNSDGSEHDSDGSEHQTRHHLPSVCKRPRTQHGSAEQRVRPRFIPSGGTSQGASSGSFRFVSSATAERIGTMFAAQRQRWTGSPSASSTL